MARAKWLSWVLLVGAVLLLSGCFAITVLDESDNGTVKSIKIGNALLIRLAGNPTAGYLWERTDSLLEAVLEPLDEGVFIKSTRWIPPSLLGGGKRRFAAGEPACCLCELHELCQGQTSQRRRQAPTLRKNGCYFRCDNAVHQVAA